MAIRVYVNGLQSWRDGFVSAFQHQLDGLGIDRASLPIHDTDALDLPARSVILYFADGGHAATARDLQSLQGHLGRGVTVIPVLDSVQNAPAKLPPPLHPFNAFALGTPHDYSGLIAEVLARIWMGRTRRKLFISYKRTDCLAVARELFDELGRRGYEVFLDEASIEYGANFQRELMWWLNDADFVLLLASPNLGSSRWVMEEIEFANIAHVGLLALRWPDDPRGPAVLSSLMSDQIYQLGPLDGSGAPDERRLAASDRDEVLRRVDEYRAHAIQRRLIALLPYLEDTLKAHKVAFAAGTRFGDFVVDRAGSDGKYYLRVLPFRPNLDTLYDFGQELVRLAVPPVRAFLCYMENDPSDRRFLAFQWCLEPERAGQSPSCYRLLPFTGRTLDVQALRS